MAWNEPGSNGSKDPWGARKSNEQGPPDMDEMVRKLQQKIRTLFGGSRRPDSSNASTAWSGLSMLVIVALIVWLLSGIYIIDPAERGVVLRFGAYVTTTGPGPHWHIPYPIESVEEVNIDQIRNVEIGFRSGDSSGKQSIESRPQEALMLTQDENIIDIKFAVQYRVKDARDYLFNVRDPDATLAMATESAVREIIGKSKMDFVLTEGRTAIAAATEGLIQNILDRYNTGLQITSVNMQDAQPPDEVQEAFQDAVRSREDEQRLINEAQTYVNDIIPRARGAAARQLEEAEAYKARVVAEAQGDASRFTQILAEYQKAPEVTRERLYIETMESVLSNTSKVMVDVEDGNNLMYLPLDRMMQQRTNQGASTPAVIPENLDRALPVPIPEDNDLRQRGRSRGTP